MEIFKFGGASVKDAEGVRNFLSVLRTLEAKKVLIVVSAMGKMTNAFEDIVKSYYDKHPSLKDKMELAIGFHTKIINDLNLSSNATISNEVVSEFKRMTHFFERNNSTDYDYVYDQIVSSAELLSTKICSAYLKDQGLDHDWLDVRKCIKTDSVFRRARLDWDVSCNLINEKVNKSRITITQGFIGSDNYGRTTTLGREGSDYTSGIFAYCLEADQVSVFKDVQGVLNADPREFSETTLIEKLSFTEAIEMAFYGASVIHPKTIQPLQRKGIPLNVRSFLNLRSKGTRIESGMDIVPQIPCFIVKRNQILISISDKEFHFVMEDDISEIFRLLHAHKMKVNLIQNSAISFSVCFEDNFNNFKELLNTLRPKYKVLFNEGLTLYTIRHFNETAIDTIEGIQEVLLEQRSRETLQLVVKK